MENKMTPELIEKARQAKSVKELISLAKENNITLTEEDAKDYFEQFYQSGELSDEELDNVSGGGCHVKVDGKKYTVVTCDTKCFTGYYQYGVCNYIWEGLTIKDGTHRCGNCMNLRFKAATGYCRASGK